MKKVIQEVRQQYHVLSNHKETNIVSTLTLENTGNNIPSYIAGQYITIYFPETGTPEGKAYSISSAPKELELKKSFSISVKAIGEFSNRLTAMMPGDFVTGSLPYGYFFSESEETPLVMIASGIGIAPFRSMIVDIVNKNSARAIHLFYSNRTLEDTVFKKELDALGEKYSNFKKYYFITREQTGLPDITHSRITSQKILSTLSDSDKKHAEFLICGSISFTRDMWRDLRSQGVSQDVIYTEAFFSH